VTEQVEALLTKVKNRHVQLAGAYAQLSRDDRQFERVSMMADYLKHWELARAEQLAKNIENSDFDETLATWLKEKPGAPDQRELGDAEGADEATLNAVDQLHSEESLERLTWQQHSEIIEAYRHLEGIAETESMKSFFHNLGDGETAEVRKTMKQLQEFSQV